MKPGHGSFHLNKFKRSKPSSPRPKSKLKHFHLWGGTGWKLPKIKLMCSPLPLLSPICWREKFNETLCCVDSRPSGWKHRHTVHNQQTRTRQDSQTVDQALRHIIAAPAREVIDGVSGRARPGRAGPGQHFFLFVFFNLILDFKS